MSPGKEGVKAASLPPSPTLSFGFRAACKGAVGGDRQADIVESLVFISILLPDNKKDRERGRGREQGLCWGSCVAWGHYKLAYQQEHQKKVSAFQEDCNLTRFTSPEKVQYVCRVLSYSFTSYFRFHHQQVGL